MTYLAKTIILPVLGQYGFTFPAATAVVGHVFTPVYLNGTTTFLDYCAISGDSIILQPGDYLIECYLSATKDTTTRLLTYKLVVDGVDPTGVKGFGYLSRGGATISPDGFQYDLTVDEGTTKTIQVKCHAVTGTYTYISDASTMLIWRI